MVPPERWTLLYDAECRFCRWSLGWILRWDRGRRLAPLALQDPAAVELLPEMDESERMASWHLVGPDGSVASGGSAAAPLLRLLPGGRWLGAVAARAPGTVDAAYGWVTRNRARLARPLGARALARADALIAERSPESRAFTIAERGKPCSEDGETQEARR
jgi:predicted DCC family thiol-disulfide oxidoreductase YuxK